MRGKVGMAVKGHDPEKAMEMTDRASCSQGKEVGSRETYFLIFVV